MKDQKRDKDYLEHISQAIDKIEKYCDEHGETGFYENEMMQDAVIRNLEIIGEAVSKLSPSLKEEYEDIPWRQISGMRNRLIHGYMSVNLEVVWNTIEKILPKFSEEINDIKRGLG